MVHNFERIIEINMPTNHDNTDGARRCTVVHAGCGDFFVALMVSYEEL